MQAPVPRRLRFALSLACFALLAAPALAGGPYRFFAITPCRLVDTRSTNPPAQASGTERAFTVQGTCGVPTGATAVVVNATAIGPTNSGVLVLWAADAPMPLASTLNFSSSDPAVSNGAIVSLAQTAPNPDLKVMASLSPNPGASVQFTLDVTGYFCPLAGCAP